MKKKKATPKSSPNQSHRDTRPKPPGKLFTMLAHFANGERLHRFQAERLMDHVLPTTVSDLQIQHGIYFSRKRIKVPNRLGTLTSVMLYWLEGENLEKARDIAEINKAA